MADKSSAAAAAAASGKPAHEIDATAFHSHEISEFGHVQGGFDKEHDEHDRANAWPDPHTIDRSKMHHVERPSMAAIRHPPHPDEDDNKENEEDSLTQPSVSSSVEADRAGAGYLTYQGKQRETGKYNPATSGGVRVFMGKIEKGDDDNDRNNKTSSSSSYSRKRTHHWYHFYHHSSPYFRFFILWLAMLVPFGGHVIKYSISSLQKEMLADHDFHLDHTQLGMFQSAVSIPNLFMPILGGLLLDKRGNARGTILMLCICLLGHLGFVLACTYKSFHYALASRILFGLGQGSTVVAQGRICATWFVGRELVFAIALAESAHNLSNWIAFVYVVPVSQHFGGYLNALWVGVAFCVMSLIAGILFFYINENWEEDEETRDRLEQDDHRSDDERSVLIQRTEESRTVDGRTTTSTNVEYNTFRSPINESPNSVTSNESTESVMPVSRIPLFSGLSIGFLLLCLIHMIYSNCYHLFAYISATLIADRFHNMTLLKAGWYAGLSNFIAIFLCPIAGLFMDWCGYKMWILVICGGLTTFAYLLLLSAASVSPVPSLLMLAVFVSFMPTIMRSSVPNLVVPAVYGLAYGLYEISESLGSVIGNSYVGFLRDQTHSWDLDIEMFAGMAMLATLLVVVLIVLDHFEVLGEDSHGKPLGGLNESSLSSRKGNDRLKRSKDRFLVRQQRGWKEEEEKERREERKQMTWNSSSSQTKTTSQQTTSSSSHQSVQTSPQPSSSPPAPVQRSPVGYDDGLAASIL